jgi:hypothetical protein
MAQAYKLMHNVDKISRIPLFNHVPVGRTRLAAGPAKSTIGMASERK